MAVLLSASTVLAEPVEVRSDTAVASAGYYQLSWQADEPVVVQESATKDFASARVVYSGADNARVMSGKSDGNWFYRARTAGSESAFGDVLEVTVSHHPVERAFAFFALGALVFLATLAVIVTGARSGS